MKKFILSVLFFAILSCSVFCEQIELKAKDVKDNRAQTRLSLYYDEETKLYSINIMSIQDAFFGAALITYFHTKARAYQAYSASLDNLYPMTPNEVIQECEKTPGTQKGEYEDPEYGVYFVTYTLWAND